MFLPPKALLEMYLTLAGPHTEYASSVWDPHLQKDKTSLEDMQKFAMRVCAKQWDLAYQDLLELFQLPSLENRRLHIKLYYTPGRGKIVPRNVINVTLLVGEKLFRVM